MSSSPRRPARPNICSELVWLHLALKVRRRGNGCRCTSTERMEKLIPAASPIVATTTLTWPALAERLDQTGAHRVAQAAVMVRDPAAQQVSSAVSPRERFLLRRRRQLDRGTGTALAVACAISSVALRRGAKTRIGASPPCSALAIIRGQKSRTARKADIAGRLHRSTSCCGTGR